MGSPLRYPIPVPERTRIIWVSAEAKALWTPRIQRITQAWSATERASVGKFRSACRQSITPDELPILSNKAAEAGLALLVLGQQPTAVQYQSRQGSLVPGQAFNYNVVLASDMHAARAFSIASKNSDNAAMGDLLGYPPCCVRFFEQVWAKEGWMDTTWPMVREMGENHVIGAENIEAHPANNILLRWLGVRMVPHLPCSFSCAGTQAFGEAFMRLMATDHPEEHRWMVQLLSANVEWNAIKGTAEIRLPILKIATTTDALTEPVSVRLKGTSELEAQAKGNVFPWKPTNAIPSITPMVFHRKPALTASEAHAAGIPVFGAAGYMARDAAQTVEGTAGLRTHIDVHHDGCCDGNGEVIRTEGLVDNSAHGAAHADLGTPRSAQGSAKRRELFDPHHHDGHCHPCGYSCGEPVCDTKQDTVFTHNGFNSYDGMQRAHELFLAFYDELRVPPNPRVIDFGCGNGILLSRIAQDSVGVESDTERAAAAKTRLAVVHNMTIADYMKIDDENFDVALISAPRLTEMSAEELKVALAWFKKHAAKVLVYTYSDHNLVSICQKLKIELIGSVNINPICSIGMLEVL